MDSEKTEKEMVIFNSSPDTDFLKENPTEFQTKEWFFTYHQQHNEPFASIFEGLKPLKALCEKYVFAEEHGSSGGTPHLQGAFRLHTKNRDSALRKFFKHGVTLRKLGNWKKAFAYCIKERNRIESSEAIPEIIDTIDVNDFYPWQKNIRDLFETKADNRSIYWVTGQQGVGKTCFIKWCVINVPGCLVLNGKPADMKNGIVEYRKTHYNPPRVILSNIGFDNCMSSINYTGYEDIKDMCFYSGKYEGGMVCGNSPHLMIFANERPDTENVKFKIVDLAKPTILDVFVPWGEKRKPGEEEWFLYVFRNTDEPGWKATDSNQKVFLFD